MAVSIASLPDELIGDVEREGLNWTSAMAELIDNGFDACATRIEFKVGKESVEVIDDGHGCEFPERMFQKGFSTKRGKRGQTGRYGIGLKHASFYICGLEGDTVITTTHQEVKRLARANWGQLVKQQSWDIDDPIVDSVPGAESGTRIRLMRGKRKFPSGEQLRPVLEELSFIFAPALERGSQILFNIDGKKTTLKAPPTPDWIDFIHESISVGKKTAVIKAGVVPPTIINKRRGLSYFYAHRNILAGTAHGCGKYSTAHISGSVELDHAWKLGQNKSSVTDDDWDKLRDEVFRVMEPLLDTASKQSESIATQTLKTALEKKMNESFGRAKRPGKGGRKKPIVPQDTDRTVKEAAVVADLGQVMQRQSMRKASAITLDFINDPSEVICIADLAGSRVTLNRHFDFVRRNETDGKDALLALIMGTYINATLMSGDWQKVLPGMQDVKLNDRFATAISQNLTPVVEQQNAEAA